MNFNAIDKLLKLIETEADAIGFDLDHNRDYLDAVAIITKVEDENRPATKTELRNVTARLAGLCWRVGINECHLIDLLIA